MTVILTIRDHIGAEEAVCVSGSECVRQLMIRAVGKVVVPALEVVKAAFRGRSSRGNAGD